MRNYRANQNLMAVSAAARETAINTEQTLDLSLLVEEGDVLDLDRRRENNQNEMTGKEEPDTVYDLGSKSNGKLTFSKAQPQHFAFVLGYGLGGPWQLPPRAARANSTPLRRSRRIWTSTGAIPALRWPCAMVIWS